MTTIPDKSVQNQIQLNYQPIDFFYYQSNLTPSSVDCNNLLHFENCNETDPSWNDISFNCYRRELCVNKNLANELLNSKNTNLETETRQTDIQILYNNSKLKTINLIGGIIAIFAIIGNTT